MRENFEKKFSIKLSFHKISPKIVDIFNSKLYRTVALYSKKENFDEKRGKITEAMGQK